MKTKDKRLVVVPGNDDVKFNLGGFSDDTFSWKGWLAVWNSVKHCPNLATPLLDSGLEFDLDPQVTSDEEVLEALEFYFNLMTLHSARHLSCKSDDFEKVQGAVALETLIFKLCNLEFEKRARSFDAGATFISNLCKTELCKEEFRVKFVHEDYLFHEECSPLVQKDLIRSAAFLASEVIGFVRSQIIMHEKVMGGDVRDIVLSDNELDRIIQSVRVWCALVPFEDRYSCSSVGLKEAVLFSHNKVCEYVRDILIPLYDHVDQRGSSFPQCLLRGFNDSRQLRDLKRIE